MIADQNLQLWNGAVPNISTPTNVVDVDTLRNLGVGTPLYIRVNFNTDVRVNADSSGITFFVVYGNDSVLSQARYLTGPTVLVGTATGPSAGEVLYIPVPPVSHYAQGGEPFSTPDNAKKYFGMVFSGYNWSTATGSVTIDIVTEVNRVENIYAKGFSVT